MKKQDLIKRLKENKQKCKRFNFFGEDCHEKIDDMIDVLENDMSPYEAEESFGSDVLDVFDVLHDNMDIEDILYPEIT